MSGFFIALPVPLTLLMIECGVGVGNVIEEQSCKTGVQYCAVLWRARALGQHVLQGVAANRADTNAQRKRRTILGCKTEAARPDRSMKTWVNKGRVL